MRPTHHRPNPRTMGRIPDGPHRDSRFSERKSLRASSWNDRRFSLDDLPARGAREPNGSPRASSTIARRGPIGGRAQTSCELGRRIGTRERIFESSARRGCDGEGERETSPTRLERGWGPASATGLSGRASGAGLRRDAPARMTIDAGDTAEPCAEVLDLAGSNRSAILPELEFGGRLAQLARAPSSHGGGHWFEPSIAHHLQFQRRRFHRLPGRATGERCIGYSTGSGTLFDPERLGAEPGTARTREASGPAASSAFSCDVRARPVTTRLR